MMWKKKNKKRELKEDLQEVNLKYIFELICIWGKKKNLLIDKKLSL